MESRFEELEAQLKAHKEKYLIDTYSFSLGEVVALFKQKNIALSEHYENMVEVWSIEDKSLFIEGLFLGLPQQPFFAMRSNGKYVIYDGLQRLNCILDFMQLVGDKEGFALELPNTKHCPALHGLRWYDIYNTETFETYLVMKLRQAKLTFYILKDNNVDCGDLATEIKDRLNK